MRRSLCLLLVVLLWPASAQAEEFTERDLFITATDIGPRRDTDCRINATLFTPKSASRANPVPAIMATNGFGGSKNDQDTQGRAYAARGYAFLTYSGLGFGGSECRIRLDDRDWDGLAGSQLVSFLGGSKAADDGTRIDYVLRDSVDHAGVRRPDDPRVGMIGGSYGGQIQFAIAGVDARLDAIVPQITWNDLAYSLAPNNTDLVRGVTYATPGVGKTDWPALFTALGIVRGAEGIAGGDTSKLGPCPNYADQICPALARSAAFGYPDAATLALLRHASVASFIRDIKIPTLISQGQSDNLFNLQEAVATYQALFAQGTPVKMIWRSAGHNGGGLRGSENSASQPETAYETRFALEWFDFYLRGIGDAPLLNFSFFTDWLPYPAGKDAAPAVGSTPTYPAADEQTFFLSGGGALVSSNGDVEAGTAAFAAEPQGSSTEGGFAPGAGEDPPGTTTTFQTAPLDAPFDVVGIPRLTVRLSAPAHAGAQGSDPTNKLVLFARLHDVAPDGRELLPRNLISAVRVGDVTKPVTIELPGIVHRFAKGHRLRLTLATTSGVYRGNTVAGPVTVAIDPAAAPTLTVPRLGAQLGAAGTGPGGTTAFTPAKRAPAPQRPGLGGPRNRAASLGGPPCVSKRVFRIRLPRPRSGGIRRAIVTVDGKRVKVVFGRRATARIDLRGKPRGTVRVQVTVTTKAGRVLRQARTYRTCRPGSKGRRPAARR